jgi:hypothetical protein
MGRPKGFVCDGTCAGNELGDCNHGDSNDGLHHVPNREDASWNLGYEQAVEEVLSEVRKYSPTPASAIMNRFPTWKAIVHEASDRAGRQGRLDI